MSKDPRSRLLDWLRTGALPLPSNLADAEALVAAAEAERVAGLLYARLNAEKAPWPAGLREGLRTGYFASFQRGVQQMDLAARAAMLLEARGLRTLPLKGAAVAEAFYDSVAERPMGDVDLLALDDFTASARVLVEGGFREAEKADHAWALVDPASGGIVELHHSLTSCAGFFPIDADALWARSRPGAGQVRRVPGPEDLLVHLSLHAAFQHGLGLTLVQYLDFRRVLERASVDEALLLDIAARARAEGALALALLRAVAVVAAPVSASLRAALDSRLPAAFTPEARPSVGRLRWALSRGRRLELLWRTVAPQAPGVHEGLGRRLVHASVRAASLVRRWGLPVLRG